MTNHNIRRRLFPATAAVNNWLTQQNVLQLLLSSSADMQKTPASPPSPSQPPPFKLRLHLIRHGETIANVHNIVLGQGDSPLTSNGVAVASMFYTNYYSKVVADRDFNNNNNNRATTAAAATGGGYYWRTYCSDLHRAHRTAKIALGLEDVHGNELLQHQAQQRDSSQDSQDDSNNNYSSNNNNINLIVDPRLRELAKGAREGYRKSFSYEEALEARRVQEASLINARTTAVEQKKSSKELIDIPLLESADDAWTRVKDWIDSLVVDAAIEHHDDTTSATNNNSSSSNNNNNKQDTSTKIYNVFTLSHSALIRTMIYKMAEAQLSSFQYEFNSEGKLWLPNLSRTVIDVCPSYYDCDYVLMNKTNDKEKERIGSYSSFDNCIIDGNGSKDLMNVRRQGRFHDLRWSCNLVDLADVSHLSNSDDDDDDADLCHG